MRSTNSAPLALSNSYFTGSPPVGTSMITLRLSGGLSPTGILSICMARAFRRSLAAPQHEYGGGGGGGRRGVFPPPPAGSIHGKRKPPFHCRSTVSNRSPRFTISLIGALPPLASLTAVVSRSRVKANPSTETIVVPGTRPASWPGLPQRVPDTAPSVPTEKPSDHAKSPAAPPALVKGVGSGFQTNVY